MPEITHRKAFTTPELLMTLVVFSFGILPLIVLFQTSHRTTAQAKNLMVAQSLGRTIIDEVRALGFDGIKYELENPTGLFHENQQLTGTLVPSDPDSLTYPDYYSRFETKLSAMLIDSNFDPTRDDKAMKYVIELEISWQEATRKYSLAFETVVVKYGAI